MLKPYLLLMCCLQSVSRNYFCSFPCSTEHTACNGQKPCILSYACGHNGKVLPLGNKDKEWVLYLHNTLRTRIALGQDTRGGNSQASNMNTISYDEELEFVAQCWANACRGTGVIHDTCRTTKKFSNVGQNAYASKTAYNLDLNNREFLTEAIKSWYEDINMSNTDLIDSYNDHESKYFTQLMWAETTHVGCGRTAFSPRSNYYSLYIYCNYGTGGNIEGDPVYKRGTPCSECNNSSCNEDYKGLCGEVKVSEGAWIVPFAVSFSARLKVSLWKTTISSILLAFM
ncbi:hypothetical protein ILUMI_03933 [Ignelater luminosus]|uniref:SCP domain-containing protein n=1 Tax=Ignelater luminosus TaxID=2038154 RepID=A0A8K0DA29_IGNLU|nr:hypothetical protein ILUMI_03933 [Ignelater luminosus]